MGGVLVVTLHYKWFLGPAKLRTSLDTDFRLDTFKPVDKDKKSIQYCPKSLVKQLKLEFFF